MPFITDNALNALLAYIRDNAETLHICSQEPTTYAEANSTYTLGNKTSPSVAAPSDKAGGGREIEFAAITDGSVTDSGTVSHWAVVDVTGTELLATGALTASQAVTSGNPFTLTSFAIGVPDAV